MKVIFKLSQGYLQVSLNNFKGGYRSAIFRLSPCYLWLSWCYRWAMTRLSQSILQLYHDLSSNRFGKSSARDSQNGIPHRQTVIWESPELRYGDPVNTLETWNGGSADITVRGSRYQYAQVKYVGFVRQGIRSNTFSDGECSAKSI